MADRGGEGVPGERVCNHDVLVQAVVGGVVCRLAGDAGVDEGSVVGEVKYVLKDVRVEAVVEGGHADELVGGWRKQREGGL